MIPLDQAIPLCLASIILGMVIAQTLRSWQKGER